MRYLKDSCTAALIAIGLLAFPQPAQAVNSPANDDVLHFGDAGFYGSTGNLSLNHPVVGMAATPTGLGYWEVASDGGIFSYGDAKFHGSTGNLALNQPIVAMATTTTGNGYWLVAADGGVFTFGDAAFHGSTGSLRLNQPVVAMAPDPDGHGYWLVARDGGVFAFGAPFLGSTGGIKLNRPIVGMSSDPDGYGYWLVAADGGVFSYEAAFHGSTGNINLNKPITAMVVSASGYWLIAGDGGVFSFNSPFFGSAGTMNLAGKTVVGAAVSPSRSGYWMVLRQAPVAPTPPPSTGSSRLAQLRVNDAAAPGGYDRSLFPMWRDLDGNGCDAREDTLIVESIAPATTGSGCSIVSGSWYSIYDGVSTTESSSFDIDHMVPLANAWRSGADTWDAGRRIAFANHLDFADHLIAVSATSNRSKSDRSPDQWKPPRQQTWCRYATGWVTVKITWSLTVTTPERDALGQMLATC